MTRTRTSIIAGVTALVLTAGLTACGGSSKTTTSTSKSKPSTSAQARTIVGGSTTLTINPGTAAKLKAAGITVVPSAPGKVAAGAAVLPADGGRIIVKSLIGSVHSSAGLTFQKGASKVVFENVAVNTESRKITGSYTAKGAKSPVRIAIYQMRLKGLTSAKGKNGALVAKQIDLVLARGAVALLNTGLNVKIFRNKQPFGTASFTVVTKNKATTKKKKHTSKKSSSTTTSKSSK